MQRRKEIDKFLIALDNFIEWFEEYEAMDLINIFYNKEIKINSLWKNFREVPLPNLENFLNWERIVSYSTSRIWTKWRKSAVKATWKSSKYIRRLTYWMEWKEINEVSYDHFFKKVMFFTSNITDLELEYLSKDYLVNQPSIKILVPTELFDSLDLCFFKKTIN